MRLTSYNIAVVALKAECCASAYVERMWGYIEEGDTEKEQCAYEKALQLSFLIDTLKRWRPTITEGYYGEILADFSAVTYPDPFIHASTIVNGVNILQPFIAYGGNSAIIDKYISCGTVVDDDYLQYSAEKKSASTFLAKFISKEQITSIQVTSSDFLSGNEITTIATPVTQFTGAVPNCLTDEEVLSVVEKIQQICTCGC
jgi:hypothetical protein